MRLTTLDKRLTTLENIMAHGRPNNACSYRSAQQQNFSTTAFLEGLIHEALDIKDRAESAGDQRTALACVRELCRLVELAAKLRGELDERPQANILNVSLDPDTAKRIAETYLARHRALEPEAK